LIDRSSREKKKKKGEGKKRERGGGREREFNDLHTASPSDLYDQVKIVLAVSYILMAFGKGGRRKEKKKKKKKSVCYYSARKQWNREKKKRKEEGRNFLHRMQLYPLSHNNLGVLNYNIGAPSA